MEPISPSIQQSFLDNWKISTEHSHQEIPSYSEIHHPHLGLISKFSNLVESANNPLDHSEILAIRGAQKKLQSKYLNECSLITSLEPCLHCSGAIVRSRLRSVLYFLPTRLGDGISSLPIEFIYNLNFFPELCLIENESIQQAFRNFFLKKR